MKSLKSCLSFNGQLPSCAAVASLVVLTTIVLCYFYTFSFSKISAEVTLDSLRVPENVSKKIIEDQKREKENGGRNIASVYGPDNSGDKRKVNTYIQVNCPDKKTGKLLRPGDKNYDDCLDDSGEFKKNSYYYNPRRSKSLEMGAGINFD
ncbi:MAG: hypothetical protein HQK49_16930 [Oligoflexia bacterium]|nr:hypothetical protein [Oligoflexia bacterium]